MEAKKQRIEQLVEQLNKASAAYYNGQDEIMSNYEWDATVSYTHLDVYKRQHYMGAWKIISAHLPCGVYTFEKGCPTCSATVSYTHLPCCSLIMMDIVLIFWIHRDIRTSRRIRTVL